MAYFHRLVLFVFLAVSPVFAFAVNPPAIHIYYAQWTGGPQSQGTDPQSMCVFLAASRVTYGHNQPFTGPITFSAPTHCMQQSINYGELGQYYWCTSGTLDPNTNTCIGATGPACPPNAIDSTGTGLHCECQSPYSMIGGVCVKPQQNACDLLNQTNQPLTSAGVHNNNMTFCYDGQPIKARAAAFSGGGGANFYPPFSCPPGTCSMSQGSEPEPGIPDPTNNCRPNEFSGTVNGQHVCVPGQPAVGDNGNGQSGANPLPSPPAPPGSYSWGSSTSCSGGMCTTTTTYKGQDGTTTTGTNTTTYPQPDYCALHPSEAVCGGSGGGDGHGTDCTANPTAPGCAGNDGSSDSGGCEGDHGVQTCKGDAINCAISQWTLDAKCALQAQKKTLSGGADCASPPVCTGDEITCGLLKETWKRNCKIFEEDSTESILYRSSSTKTGDLTGTLTTNSTVNLGAGNFDQTNLLGTGSCIHDLTVTVMAHPFVLPLSQICSFLSTLGAALLAVSFIVAAKIVSGRK